ncbi:MAG: ATP-binding cassette domain-containing protein [Mycoplasmatota bacterium]
MLKVNNLSLRFATKTLFNEVNLEFNGNNCYGLIGANGAGKSTFLKILSNEIDPTTGDVTIGKYDRMSILKQDHHSYDEYDAIQTVIMGNTKLYNIMIEKDALYMKEDFSEADGIKAGELEGIFAEMNGWQAESDAAILLSGLGIDIELQSKQLKDLKDSDKVKVLLAQALFGEPDILLLDEPTNGLDVDSKHWLEEFLIEFKNTVILVSHDRHFLNKVCTHMVDIDYNKIKMYVGNYDFWYQSSELIQKQMRDSNKKKEEKIKELQDFIARFSANASKSKQATSRKKSLEKIVLDEIVPSSRKYPYVNFEFEKALNNEIITLSNINYSIDGKVILKNFSLNLNKDDKIALIGQNEIAKTTLFKIITGEIIPDSGTIKLGPNTKLSYFAKNHESLFLEKENMIEWLRKYSLIKEEAFVRGFLGRMLFSGDDSLKLVNVLSGGEKVRCVLSKIMLEKPNLLIMDEPTNHLDIESITALNNGLEKFRGSFIISSLDEQIIETTSNRLILIREDGTYKDKYMGYQEFISKYGNK